MDASSNYQQGHRDAYHQGQQDARLASLETIVDEIRTDVKALLQWRAWMLGATAAVSACVSFVVAYLFKLAR